MKLQSTCIKEKCFYWDFFDHKCPYFIENWFKPPNEEAYLVEDCSHRRLLMMVQDLHTRFTGVQQSQEQMRNEAAWVQVVAEVLGKNSGIDLEAFVKERQRKLNISNIKKEQIEE